VAVWSVVTASNVQNSFGRFDAEFYRPESLDALAKVKSNNHHALRQIVLDGYRVVYENTKILPAERINKNCVRFLQSANISSNGLSIDLSSIGFVKESEWDRYPKGRIQQGELLIEVKGQAEKVTIVANGFPARTLVSGTLFKLKIDSAKVSPFFVYAYFSSKYGKILRDRLKTNTLIGFVSKPQLYSIPVPIPERGGDMQEVADTAESAFNLLRESELSYSKAEMLIESELELNQIPPARSLTYESRYSMLEASRRLDAEYHDPLVQGIIDKITTFDHTVISRSFSIGSGFPWSSNRFLSDNSGDPVVRIRNIRPTHIDPDELTSIDPKYARSIGFPKAKRGDIVVGMDGIKNFYASILTGDCHVNQRVAHLRAREGAVISAEYAAFIINSRIGQAQLLREMTIATTVGHITSKSIGRIVVPFVSQGFHDQITSLVKDSIDKKQRSKELLFQAKARVEQLIEEAVAA